MCQENVKSPLQNNYSSWQDVRSLAGVRTRGGPRGASYTMALESGRGGIEKMQGGDGGMGMEGGNVPYIYRRALSKSRSYR